MKTSTVLGLVVPAISIAAVALHHDLFRSYITTSDADLVYVYEGLLFNDGMPQLHVDPPGQPYFVLLGIWFGLLRFFGLISAAGYGEIVTLEPDAFDQAYGQIVFAGRALSILLAGIFASVIFLTLLRWTRNALVALLAALVFSASTGITHHTLIIRTELLAGLFMFLAFIALLRATQARPGCAELLVGVCGFLAVMALATKVVTVFALLGMVVLIFFFGRRSADTPLAADHQEYAALVAFLVIAACAVGVPAGYLVVRMIQIRQVSGIYHVLTAVYVVAALAIYGLYFRFSIRRVIGATAAMAIGLSLGLLILQWRSSYGATAAVVNYIDHMLVFARAINRISGKTVDYLVLLRDLAAGIPHMIRGRIAWPPRPWETPFFVLEIFTLCGAAVLWRRGEKTVAMQAFALIGLAYSLELAFNLRHFALHYRILTDPWVIVGAGLVLARLLRTRNAERQGLAVTVAAVSAGLVLIASWDHALLPGAVPRQADDNACYQTQWFSAPMAQQFQKYCQQQPN